MRILLVRVTANTAAMQGFYKVVRMEPLSLEYLGAAVKDNHDVKIFDMRLEGGWEGLRTTIEAYKPHVVGTGGDTCEANACKEVLGIAKEWDLRTCFRILQDELQNRGKDFELSKLCCG